MLQRYTLVEQSCLRSAMLPLGGGWRLASRFVAARRLMMR